MLTCYLSTSIKIYNINNFKLNILQYIQGFYRTEFKREIYEVESVQIRLRIGNLNYS